MMQHKPGRKEYKLNKYTHTNFVEQILEMHYAYIPRDKSYEICHVSLYIFIYSILRNLCPLTF